LKEQLSKIKLQKGSFSNLNRDGKFNKNEPVNVQFTSEEQARIHNAIHFTNAVKQGLMKMPSDEIN
jgi:hypothetical protein